MSKGKIEKWVKFEITMTGNRRRKKWTKRTPDLLLVVVNMIDNRFNMDEVVKIEEITMIYDNKSQPPKKIESRKDVTEKFHEMVKLVKGGDESIPTITIEESIETEKKE